MTLHGCRVYRRAQFLAFHRIRFGRVGEDGDNRR